MEWNVAYSIKGHAIFLNDGSEINNVIGYNLVVNTVLSWSLLNTDSVPSCFWIRNPKNSISGNRAAGSDGYGFWLNLPDHPTGVLYDPNKCPSGQVLGAFNDNGAHTCTKGGLQQSNIMNPK